MMGSHVEVQCEGPGPSGPGWPLSDPMEAGHIGGVDSLWIHGEAVSGQLQQGLDPNPVRDPTRSEASRRPHRLDVDSHRPLRSEHRHAAVVATAQTHVNGGATQHDRTPVRRAAALRTGADETQVFEVDPGDVGRRSEGHLPQSFRLRRPEHGHVHTVMVPSILSVACEHDCWPCLPLP